jgi:hypothetical protein
VPRILEELPRHGHTYYLDVPKRENGQPKSKRVQHIGKNGELKYVDARRRGRPLHQKGDILRYEVWCTVCMDQGCDKCPPYTKDET